MRNPLVYILPLILFPTDLFSSEVMQHMQEAWSVQKCFVLILITGLVFYAINRYVKHKKSQQIRELEVIIEERTKELQERNKELELLNKELKQSKELKEEEAEAKEKFYSVLAHDLKSPFNVLIGASEIIMEEKGELDEDTRDELINEIYLTASGTFKLLENLLDWTRTQTGRIRINTQEVNLLFVTEEVLDTMKIIAKHKGVDIKLSIPKDIEVYADPSMLAAIIRNLMANAVKFSYPESVVKIEAVVDGKNVHLQVKDKGVGIESEKLQCIFDKNGIVSTPGTAQEKGTGLGLILCNEFAKHNKGKIGVESTHGKGSVFTLELPNATVLN